MDKLKIDKKLEWTPSRTVKGCLKFPDHYALHLVLKNIPTRNKEFEPNPKEIIWNTKKRDGWKIFKENTENNENLLNAASLETESPVTIVFSNLTLTILSE